MKATMEKHSSFVAYFTSGSLFGTGAMTLNDVAMIVGIITGVGTFVVNWWYKRKEFKLRERGVESRDAPRC